MDMFQIRKALVMDALQNIIPQKLAKLPMQPRPPCRDCGQSEGQPVKLDIVLSIRVRQCLVLHGEFLRVQVL